MKVLNITMVYFQREKNGPWETGVAFTSDPGLCNVLLLVGADAQAVTAKDGGSPSINNYHLTPHMGAIRVVMED